MSPSSNFLHTCRPFRLSPTCSLECGLFFFMCSAGSVPPMSGKRAAPKSMGSARASQVLTVVAERVSQSKKFGTHCLMKRCLLYTHHHRLRCSLLHACASSPSNNDSPQSSASSVRGAAPVLHLRKRRATRNAARSRERTRQQPEARRWGTRRVTAARRHRRLQRRRGGRRPALILRRSISRKVCAGCGCGK